MMQRTYNQYCPIAHALDLIGDRWTFLIVRDLLLGPKRFGDLAAGLPGIGTNLLTDRLRLLEQTGILQRQTLPPPAGVQVYALTAYGQELEGSINALARWGAHSLGERQQHQIISTDTVLLTARALLRSWPVSSPATTFRLHLRDGDSSDPLLFHGAGTSITPGAGSADDMQISLSLDIATLYALAGGQQTIADALAHGALISTDTDDISIG